jgi:hypothetical protein
VKVAYFRFSATKQDFVIADDVPERHLSDIESLILRSDLI